MKKNVAIIVLWTIFVVSSLEVIFYFLFIYKVFDRVTLKVALDAKEIPTLSEILSRRVIVDDSVIINDDLKKFYSGKIGYFSDNLNTTLGSGNSFVKFAQANYVISGTVTDVEILKPNSTDLTAEYKITLRNAFGAKYTEIIKAQETENIKITLMILSSGSPARVAITFDQLQNGDYLILDKSTNLLSQNNKVDIKIEVLRKAN